MEKGTDPHFEVIIPVVNVQLAYLLIASMERNTIKPKRVIIIDNSGEVKRGWPDSTMFPIETYLSETGLVNESLNLGISRVSKECDYVTILNDDILLGGEFFDRIEKTFNAFSDCGVACPQQVFSLEELVMGKVTYTGMGKREGPAMTIKKSVLDMIDPIPHKRLPTFHGDDWIWVFTRRNGYNWYKDTGNVVYHAVGTSILSKGFRKFKKKERNEWCKIHQEIHQS